MRTLACLCLLPFLTAVCISGCVSRSGRQPRLLEDVDAAAAKAWATNREDGKQQYGALRTALIDVLSNSGSIEEIDEIIACACSKSVLNMDADYAGAVFAVLPRALISALLVRRQPDRVARVTACRCFDRDSEPIEFIITWEASEAGVASPGMILFSAYDKAAEGDRECIAAAILRSFHRDVPGMDTGEDSIALARDWYVQHCKDLVVNGAYVQGCDPLEIDLPVMSLFVTNNQK